MRFLTLPCTAVLLGELCCLSGRSVNPRVERVATSRLQHRRLASTESAAVESSPRAFDHADRRIDHRAQAADRRACRQKARHHQALRHRRFARSGQCATPPLPTHSIRFQTRQTYQETNARTFIAGTRAENADGDPITPSPTVRARLASIRPMRHPTVGARHARRGRRRRRRGPDADPEFRPCFHRRLRVERPSRHDRRRRPSRSISARVRTPPPARAHARHRETNNNNPTPLPPSRAHRPRLIARRVQLARPRGVSRKAFKPAQAIQPAGALSNLPARATSPPRTRPVPPQTFAHEGSQPTPRAQDWDEWGAFENEVASAVTSVASTVTNMVGGGGNRGGQPRRSPAGRAPARDPQVSRGATDSTPRNAPARIVFFTLPPAVADRTSPDLSRPVTRRTQPPCRTS